MSEQGSPRTSLSRHLIKFLKDEEEAVLRATDDSDREEVMRMYHKSKITVEDMQREYTPEEVRMLCERTKVRVKMYNLNPVWDAKKRFDAKKRLENKSESFVYRMFVKAHMRRMVKPYSDLEREKYKELAACQTKKDNNVRLDRWHRQRFGASKSNGLNGRSELPCAPLDILISSSSEPEDEEIPVSQTESVPLLSVEPIPAPLESQPQSQSDESTMDDLLQQLPAQKPLSDQDSEPNLWGIGEEQEVEVVIGKDGPPAHLKVSDLNSYDWQQMEKGINSESLATSLIPNTQNTEPDYECFGTQVVAASTQDTVESQQFF